VDEQMARHVLDQAFELWFAPELNRKVAAGLISEGFKVWGVQVLMDLDLDRPKIRFNEEIQGVFEAEVGDTLKKGEIVPLPEKCA
jgi:hypothetical protein